MKKHCWYQNKLYHIGQLMEAIEYSGNEFEELYDVMEYISNIPHQPPINNIIFIAL